MKEKEINVICIGDLRYRFGKNTVKGWTRDDKLFRIDFTDGSYVEFNRNNIIAIEYNR